MIEDHAAYEPTEEEYARAREAAEEMGKIAQKLGLYQQDYTLGTATGSDGELRLIIISTMTAGEIAFTDRILNPEESDINDEFVNMKTELERQEFDEYRETLRRRVEGDDE